MKSSELKYQIELQVEVETKNSYGVPQRTWATKYKPWASKRIRSGGLTTTEHSEFPTNTVEWHIRYRSDINYGYRIKYKNSYYKIEFIEEIGREEELRIDTTVITFNEY